MARRRANHGAEHCATLYSSLSRDRTLLHKQTLDVNSKQALVRRCYWQVPDVKITLWKLECFEKFLE